MSVSAPVQPAAFPEPWDAPVEGNATYLLDMMHNPYPMSPLSDSAGSAAFAVGFTKAAREFHAPIKQVHVANRNMYHYERHEVFEPADEAEARRMGEAAEAAIKPDLARMLERWEQEHLPALRALQARLRAIDVESVPMAAVVAALDEVSAIHREMWTIHFRVAIPMLLGLQVFDEFYAEVFDGSEGDGHALLVGVLSESVKAGLGLYDLAVRATELGLEPVFRDTSSPELLTALERTEAGRTLVAALGGYLTEYGLRQDLFDLITPTWSEDPTFALASIRAYIQSGRDARAEYAATQRAAEDAIAAARAHLTPYPEAVRGQFEALLQIGRAGAFLQEEHNFYIDQQTLSLIRLFYLRVGGRLEDDGVLADADDVFMLLYDELHELCASLDLAGERERVRALVATRREQFALARTLTPPPFIGPPPAGPPPTDNPMARALGRFFGGPPPQPENPGELKGNPGSRGVVSGRAFIARTLDEAGGLQPGEILVAVTTMPPWTPLFGVAAAVVTETGGPLSHCAIVAREYGIPAVVGAAGATRVIQPGQTITVDGARGIVTFDA
jgi:pyruvate,water dikinase